jgi:hypothetical protein
MHVDLDHAGVGRHLDVAQARIFRRRIAFQVHRPVVGGRNLLDGRHQRSEILGIGERRHKDAQVAVARLDGHGRAHGLLGCFRIERLLVVEYVALRERRLLAHRVIGQDGGKIER